MKSITFYQVNTEAPESAIQALTPLERKFYDALNNLGRATMSAIYEASGYIFPAAAKEVGYSLLDKHLIEGCLVVISDWDVK